MGIHSTSRFFLCKRWRKYPFYLVVAVLIWAILDTIAVFNQVHHAKPGSSLSKSETVAAVFDNRVYKERERRVKSQCGLSEQGSIDQVFLHDGSKLAYCPVAKIGSTFWKRIFIFLHNDTGRYRVKTPFHIPRVFVHYGKKVRTQILKLNATTDHRILRNFTRFMFVRNPYSRLWSAYLDKFFLPDFWRTFAKAVTQKRIYTTEKAKRCGNDVTFQEFLEYVASLAPVKMNEHWQPIKYRCDPCQFKPDIIGKQETFSDDSRYILNNISQGWIREDFNNDVHVEEEISMLVDYNFRLIRRSKSFYENCTNKADIARRLWQVFQTNGYLPLNISADGVVRNLTTTHIDRVTFKDYVQKTYRQHPVTERKLWKLHRKEALRGAFKSVPKLLLRRIVEIFRNDFEMFGYDMEPPWIKY